MEKRAGRNRILHFGKRFAPGQDNGELDETLQAFDELVKRAGQNRMLHFGKYLNEGMQRIEMLIQHF